MLYFFLEKKKNYRVRWNRNLLWMRQLTYETSRGGPLYGLIGSTSDLTIVSFRRVD